MGEQAYEVVWMNANDSRLVIEKGLTKAAMARLCANENCVILSVRILWR